MKKYRGLGIAFLASIFFAITPSYAAEFNFDELGKKLNEEVSSKTDYVYIIGEYIFTSSHELTTQDTMLAARTSVVTEEDGKTDKTPIYGKMAIQQLERDYDDDFNPTGRWNIIDNLLGETQINEQQKFNIKYIDYKYLSETTKFKVSFDVENKGDYKEVLKEHLNFEASEAYEDSTIELDENNKLQGLLLRNDKVTLNDDDIAKYGNPTYYFAYILEVPGATAKTKITSKRGTSGIEEEIEYKDFDIKDGNNPGIVVLVPLNEEDIKKAASEKIVTITVDLDGEGNKYDSTTYTIDWSELKFQKSSSANISENIPYADLKDFSGIYGYTKTEKDTYKLTDATGNKFNLTGKIYKQEINDDIFKAEQKTGFYFVYNINSDDFIKNKTTVTIPAKGEKDDKKTITVSDEYGVSVLFALNPKADRKPIEITIDLDGEGNKYFPITYTIDYSELEFWAPSEFTMSNGKVEDVHLAESEDEIKAENSDFTIDEDGKLTGTVKISDNVSNSSIGKKEGKDTEYYVAVKLTIPGYKNAEDNENGTTISIKDSVFIENEEVNVNVSSNENGEVTLLLPLSKDEKADDKITITVLLSNGAIDGVNYEAVSKSLTYSELGFEGETEADITLDIPEGTEFENGWKYEIQDASDLSLTKEETDEEDNINLNLEGTIKQQRVEEDEKEYYFAFNVNVHGYEKDKTEIEITPNSDEDIIEKIETETGVTVLVTPSIEEDKTYTVRVNADGEDGELYDDTTYLVKVPKDNIDYLALRTITLKEDENTSNIIDIYNGESLIAEDPSERNYHTFMYWSKDKESQYDLTNITEDATLVPRWTIEVDKFITDVVDDLNGESSLPASKYSGKYIADFHLNKYEHDLTFNILNPVLTFEELDNEISIPAAIAYVLGKEEINSVTIKFRGEENHKVILESDDEETIKNKFKELLEESIEAYDEDVEDLSDILGKEDFYFTLEVTDLVETVELSDEDKEAYTFYLESNFVAVDSEDKLNKALQNESVNTIYITDNFEIKTTKTINRPLIITGGDETNTITMSSENEQEYMFVINSENVVISNLNLTGSKVTNEESEEETETIKYSSKRAIQVQNGATLKVNTVDVSGNRLSGIKVEDGATFVGTDLTCNDESYSHPVVWTYDNANVSITIKDSDSEDGKEISNIVKDAQSIERNIDGKWTDDDFRDEDGEYYDYAKDEEGKLKKEYKDLIESSEINGRKNVSDSKNSFPKPRTYYYLNESHTKLHTIYFWDTHVRLLLIRYVFDDEKPLEPVINKTGTSIFFPETYTSKEKTYKFEGWSTSENGEKLEEIPNATKDTAYYTKYVEVQASELGINSEIPNIEEDTDTGYSSSDQEYILDVKENVILVSGLINETKKTEESEGQYLFALTLTPAYTDDIEIRVTDLNNPEKEPLLYTSKDFNKAQTIARFALISPLALEKKSITLLLPAYRESDIKAYEISVDADGAEKNDYAPTTVTVDYSELAIGLADKIQKAAKKTQDADSLKITNNGTANLIKEYNKKENKMVTTLIGNRSQEYLESIDGNDYYATEEERIKVGRNKYYQDIFSRDLNNGSETEYGDWSYVFRGFESFIVDDLKLLENGVKVVLKDIPEASNIETSEDGTTEYQVTVSEETVKNYISYMYGASGSTSVTNAKDTIFTVVLDENDYVVSIKGTITATVAGKSKPHNVNTTISGINDTNINPQTYNMDNQEAKEKMRKDFEDALRAKQKQNNQ